MVVIDFTEPMVPVGLGGVSPDVGIGSRIDGREREMMRGRAMRVGAWWLGRREALPG
jgi:hypothetical protein